MSVLQNLFGGGNKEVLELFELLNKANSKEEMLAIIDTMDKEKMRKSIRDNREIIQVLIPRLDDSTRNKVMEVLEHLSED